MGSSSGIRVSPVALNAFAGRVQHDVDGAIAPHRGDVEVSFAGGVSLSPTNPSADLHAMIAKYGECLAAINEQLAAYLSATTILTFAATQIAANYESTDATSAAAIDAALDNAIARVNAPMSPRGPGRFAI
jgi:hypothetical protein